MLTRRFVAAFLFVMASVLLGALPAHAQFQLRLEQAGFPSKTVTDNGLDDTDPLLGRINYIGAYGTFAVTVNTGLSKPNIGNGVTQAEMDLNSSEFSTSTGGTLQITLADTGFAFPSSNAPNQMRLTSSVGGTFGGLAGGPPPGTSVTFRAWANPTNASPLSVDPSVIPAGSVGGAPMGPFVTSPYSANAAPVFFTKGAGPYSIFNQATIVLPGSGRVGFDHFTRVEDKDCTGKLGNYVWNDLNQNGIQESGEPGIPGITVTLKKNGSPLATTTTDANGLYQFTGLCAASYEVEVPPQQAGLTGYSASPTLQGGNFGTDSNPNPTTVLFVTGNEDDQTIDFGFYLPAPHLTLKKSPKGGTFNQGDPVSFSFVVGNDGGSPALNVHLTDQLPGNGGLVWQIGTVSQGSCTVANNLLSCNLGTIQASGAVTVTVTSVGGTPMAACQAQPNPIATATADGGLSATDSGSLNCVPPQLSIVKTPDGGTFAVGAAVTFTIVVSNPAPAGASPALNVMLTDTLPNNGGLVWNSATASQGSCTLTSNNLSCTLGTIAAGASVTVTVSSTATTPASACQLQSNPVARATGDGGLDVQDSGSVDCTQPASLGDFVWHDLDADGVQDAGEPGIPGVTVTLLKCNGTPTGMTTTTNASGFYSFTNLTPDCYKVQFATPAGFTASPANQGANDAADSDSVGGVTGNYTLAPGDNNLTVDAGFYKPASLGDFVWNDVNVNGVQNAGELGIPGVTVVLLLCNGTPTGMTTTTNAAGFYQFTNLTPGCYKVQFATPANFTPTAANQGANDAVDSDAVGGVTGNYTLNSGDNNLTVDAGFYSLPPGLTLVKSANVLITGPYQPVTYTYTVTNTGGTTLTNIVVTDDNGTPNFAGDDFIVGTIASLAPGASATLTATVIPVVSTVGVVNGNSVPAGAVIVVVTQANGDIKVTYLQSFGINDNTYGTGAIGWPSGHTFGNLTGSDKLEFRFFDKNGNMVLDIYQDYISATSLAPSGYASLCASGGDGSLVFGSLANIVSCTTSLADNLNNPLNLPNKAALIVNSPTSLVGGNVVIDPVKAPGGWNHINSYTVVVKASTFGSAGFGSVAVPDQHNSPNKLAGPNGMATTPTPSTVVNTARATANGGLTATATASVSILPGSLGPASVSGFVYYDANNNGIKEPGEIGLGTTLTLTGTDSNGTPITRTTSSDGSTGAYSFTNLPPGNYKITETQPASYLQGKNSIGTVNGVVDGVLVPVDMIDSIDLDSGDAGINFNFGEIVASTPNLTLVKSANQQLIGPYQPVTYTYTVTNTGGTTLTNIVVTDDNGTPNFSSDDITIGVIASLAPGASATLTAQIIPVVSTIGVVNGNNVPAGAVIVVVPQGNGDIKVTYLQSFGINDNTYGTGAIGWPNGHKFGDLTGSDKLEFRFFDKNGNMVLDLYQDYISTTSNVVQYPSGYASLCASGGDGSLVFGSLANIVSCTTSLADNLNNPLNLPNKAALIVNSPTSLVGGNVVIDTVKAPGGWNHINSYTVVVKASTFGAVGFGSVAVPDQHNSPNKLAGPNGMATTPTNSTVVNTATATANGGVSASGSASVAIVVPPAGGGACSAVITTLKLDKKDFQVTIKNNGASDIFLSGFALTWPALNGKLVQLKLDGDEVYGAPDIAAPSANLTAADLVGDQNKRKIGHGSSDTLHILFEANVDKTSAHYTDGLLTFGAGCTVSFP